MKNTSRFLVLAVIATTLLCAVLVWSNVVSVGHARALKDQLEAKEAELQQLAASKQDPATKPDTGLADMLAQRDAEYAKLKEDYARLQEQLTNATPVAAVNTNATPFGFGRGQRGGNNPWLERLRLQDPERYKQMVAAREQRIQRAEQQYQDQMTQLENRIQTAPSQEEVDLASQIADTLDRYGQLRQQMQALRDLPPDEQQAQMAELGPQLRALRQQLNDLRDQDRTMQYSQLADQLGLKGQDAQTLAQSIPEILKNTQYSLPGQGGRGGFGGFGGGGGNNANTGGSTASGTPATQPSTSTTK
jgi:DNA repair exonuclease SbcCD ATPase subunit